ncbi:ribosome maturation factor RimM [Hyphomicrobium sp.]|jgi:16S rRNA processing protein RimM|uniref:ribosome maturation factor RimM n=1 Tax=Hyphomicrobium sp. TaxID=82 RepID=UPI002C49341E|nr:ribosome maturation factor RimM [Hyphomicrobium sp.]HVZ05507.1 ribosome maturation factor RimM [Hyphomicrobium sp.]
MKIDGDKQSVLLGEISGVHGIRGDVLIRTYTGTPEAIADYGPLSDIAGEKTFTIKVVRTTDKGVVARIDGVNDRTAGEALRGTKLYVARSKLPETEAAEFYHTDLIGMKAVAEDDTPIGKIIAVQNFGAGDLLELEPATGGATEFIPFDDRWVPRVDLDAGVIVVNRPEPSTETDDGEPKED